MLGAGLGTPSGGLYIRGLDEALRDGYVLLCYCHELRHVEESPFCRNLEMASHIRLLAIPFAPIIVARAGGTLIAQTYISSHPASALLLVSPPPSNAAASQLLPTPLPEFNFEPRFPCAIMCSESERAALDQESRLWKDEGVDKLMVRDPAAVVEQEGLVKIEQWLDELGF